MIRCGEYISPGPELERHHKGAGAMWPGEAGGQCTWLSPCVCRVLGLFLEVRIREREGMESNELGRLIDGLSTPQQVPFHSSL